VIAAAVAARNRSARGPAEKIEEISLFHGLCRTMSDEKVCTCYASGS
jgi:hypothetical protein